MVEEALREETQREEPQTEDCFVGPRELACPVEEDIIPCVCSQWNKISLDLDCSDVEDEDDLARVFKANFPYPQFRRLTIKNNQHVKVLRKSDLGNITFEQFWITDGVLEEVEEGALSTSASTIVNLVFNFNNISSFPFLDLKDFPMLTSLDMRHNEIKGFPELYSETLGSLFLSVNPLGELPVHAFANTPSLVNIHLSQTRIPEIIPGTFENLKLLKNLGMGANLITHLDENAIQCSHTTGLIDLGYNTIRDVHVNAFPGLVNGWIYIHHNGIKFLEEEVWKPLIDSGGYIDPYGNPLECGCDVAWVVRDPVVRDGFDIYTSCADGQMLVDLDPFDYVPC
ncbi:oplophorus-luciferin 2-monooxygenase non-catalytic subunit-like [Homarus americanus]|uniref:oplophorus-luciferin 2-monooxygenase non-catalytic subunit-like n=1 Tax=Homarus americanus TaxID=6706 RepID=UPI001C43B0F7|nr:oplophorus-luciferin 2-monooxygenase non-catalytic subunit-like [Homarus americanus]